jgi:TolB protein
MACQFIAQSVYTFNLDTGEARAIAHGISPVWSPDGSMVAFLSNQSGAPELWIVRADGTGLQQLTQDGQFKSPFGNLSWLRR